LKVFIKYLLIVNTGGNLKMLNKLFGGKKSNGKYFLELNESEDKQETPTSEAPAETVEEKQPEPAKVEAVEEKQPEPAKAETVEEKQPEPAKAEAVDKKKPESVKAKSAKKGKKSVKAAPAPVAAPVVEEEPAWVKAMYNNTNGKTKKEDPTFATNHLMPLPTPRRLPGPSMNPFMAMAQKVRR
jgi:hypothetical protein